MSVHSQLPVSIDPWHLATKRAQLVGDVPISAFSRIRGLVHGHADQVAVELDFENGRRGQALVAGQASVNVEFICQRCLESVWLRLQASVQIGVVQTEREAENLPSDYEPLINEQDNLRIELLIEDDLILVLPQVACHPEGECDLPAHAIKEKAGVKKEVESTPKENPFDVLKDFKTD